MLAHSHSPVLHIGVGGNLLKVGIVRVIETDPQGAYTLEAGFRGLVGDTEAEQVGGVGGLRMPD